MKKIFAFLLAALLLASVGATVFAASESGSGQVPETGGTQTIPVTATYQAAADPGETNYVYIEWKGMEFTYSPGYVGEWDPENLNYKPGTKKDSGWTSSDGKAYGTITFENRSANEAFLRASVSFSKDGNFPSTYAYLRKSENFENVGSASTGNLTVDLPPLTLEPEDGKKSVYVVPYVPYLQSFSDTKTLGTITITISQATGDPGLPGPEIFG